MFTESWLSNFEYINGMRQTHVLHTDMAELIIYTGCAMYSFKMTEKCNTYSKVQVLQNIL